MGPGQVGALGGCPSSPGPGPGLSLVMGSHVIDFETWVQNMGWWIVDEEMRMVCRTRRSGETKYQNDLQLK